MRDAATDRASAQWEFQQLTAGAVEYEEFRSLLLPSAIHSDGLTNPLDQTRGRLIQYLRGLDLAALTPIVRKAAMTELEYTT
ncbi:hypothetical protein ACWF94_34160 [Streptomyces sp. NPDC055078]